jgi:cytoskeletal protein CcmA (bactofilin family)
MFHKSSTKSTNDVSTKNETSANARKIAPSIISADMCILGNIMSEGVLDIDGRVDGNVKSEIVYLRSSGQIVGDIVAAGEVHIYGSVHGVIKSPRVCIYASAHVEGAIIHTGLSIEDGAYVDAQFKPFQAQPLLAHRSDAQGATKINTSHGEDYDLLRDLKLIE